MQAATQNFKGHEHLIKLMQARNVRAVELVYDQYSTVLYGVIKRIVNDATRAEEILFKTFNYIWNHYSNYDSAHQSICMWMIRIARQFSFESLSSRERRDLECRLLNSLKQSDVKEEMIVLELAFFQGLPVIKIAEGIGCTESEIRTLLRRAVGKLKNELATNEL